MNNPSIYKTTGIGIFYLFLYALFTIEINGGMLRFISFSLITLFIHLLVILFLKSNKFSHLLGWLCLVVIFGVLFYVCDTIRENKVSKRNIEIISTN